MSRRELVVERRGQDNRTLVAGAIMLTPNVDEDYWSYRVMLSDTQAVVGFPKFSTIGIGFAQEDDWNTNLPYTLPAQEIWDHIKHNKGDEGIADEDCLTAIQLVKDAVYEDRS